MGANEKSSKISIKLMAPGRSCGGSRLARIWDLHFDFIRALIKHDESTIVHSILFFRFFSILFLTLFSRLAPQDMPQRLRAARRLDWDWSEWAIERALDGKQSDGMENRKRKAEWTLRAHESDFWNAYKSVMVSWRFSCSSVGMLCETFQKRRQRLFRWEPRAKHLFLFHVLLLFMAMRGRTWEIYWP